MAVKRLWFDSGEDEQRKQNDWKKVQLRLFCYDVSFIRNNFSFCTAALYFPVSLLFLDVFFCVCHHQRLLWGRGMTRGRVFQQNGTDPTKPLLWNDYRKYYWVTMRRNFPAVIKHFVTAQGDSDQWEKWFWVLGSHEERPIIQQQCRLSGRWHLCVSRRDLLYLLLDMDRRVQSNVKHNLVLADKWYHPWLPLFPVISNTSLKDCPSAGMFGSTLQIKMSKQFWLISYSMSHHHFEAVVHRDY